ncbi:alpha-1,2-mannosyltransferase ALG9 [Lingula anatina]|uniref:Mannosyltransferase n=1 Tax=Lingula anatina TaxID=7574 RepID=A0A1S3JY96_LINAN|nr:alpha-1,2-mannosyltransferase ALG9 [Lingula anatina]|eukprot:XP_013415358.1 alpha-1,2-mannosyltransferase ALG9 [Lingula anatina]
MPSTARQRNKGSKTERESEAAPPPVKSSELRRPAELGDFQPWTPTAYTAFKALMSARLCAAIWSNISDCDETFNYWEPTHFLLYGTGFQTWEYSPAYAIRSYAYLWIHALPIKLYATALSANKLLVLYFLRCILGFVCTLCEVYFYRGVCRHFGSNTGRLTLAFLIFSTGMFISCSAYLPSSFAMYMTLLAMAGWMYQHYQVSILAIAASAILGWPFAGAIGIPIAFDIVFRRQKIGLFLKWCCISLLLFLVPSVLIDSHYYGKLVVASLNIVLYNVFSQHGPDIYGVEPWTFYFINGFLDFNFVFLMALITLPFCLLVKHILKQSDRVLPLWLSTAPMYIWILIFFTRPHKEERFLFPIYPMFCVCGAVTLDHIQKLYSYLFTSRRARHYTELSNWLSAVVIILISLISVSRTVALYQYYHAPMDMYVDITRVSEDPSIHTLPADKDINVCVGKEWYRFTSSFFLPSEKWHLQFIQSEFKGQLPKPYASGPDATRIIPKNMNDMNREEPDRYVNISKCHYLIDLDLPRETKLEPRYSQQKNNWKVLTTTQFLDPSRSHKLFRAFFVPFVSSRYVTFVDYNLLQTKRTKKSSQRKP